MLDRRKNTGVITSSTIAYRCTMVQEEERHEGKEGEAGEERKKERRGDEGEYEIGLSSRSGALCVVSGSPQAII